MSYKKWKMGAFFVAFSEYLNFKSPIFNYDVKNILVKL
jgi:hypothetical protein